MTDRQEDQLSMKRTLLAIRTAFSAEISAMADLNSDFDDLETEVNAIKLLLPKQKLQTTGVARDKQELEDELIETATIISGAVMAFASKAHNNTLFDEVKYSKSKLRDTRDEVLSDTCRIIHGRANDNLAALAGRGITALVLSDYLALIVEYEGMTEAPRVATVHKSTATVGMASHFEAGLKIVKERLDGGMRIFITTRPDIHTAFRNARKIVDTGKRKRKNIPTGQLDFHVVDGSNNPIAGVLVSVDDLVGSTDVDGSGNIKGLNTGVLSVRFFKPNYAEKFMNVTITNGQITIVNVTLDAPVSAGTGTVSGQVMIGMVPAQVTISVDGTTISTSLPASGNYVLNDVPEGPQVIRAERASNPAVLLTENTTVVAGGNVVVNFSFP